MKLWVWICTLLIYISFATSSTLDKFQNDGGVSNDFGDSKLPYHRVTKRPLTHFNVASLVTTRWGRLTLWGAFGYCSTWPGNAIVTAVDKCQARYNNHDYNWTDCSQAAIEAVARTFAFGMFGAAINAAIVDNRKRNGVQAYSTILEFIWLATVMSLRIWTLIRSRF